MRARQDEDTALDRSSLVTCGWDPGKDDAEASLSDCETVLACAAYTADGSTFVDDFAVAGGISGNGLPTTTATTLDFGLWSGYFVVTLASTGPIKRFR